MWVGKAGSATPIVSKPEDRLCLTVRWRDCKRTRWRAYTFEPFKDTSRSHRAQNRCEEKDCEKDDTKSFPSWEEAFIYKIHFWWIFKLLYFVQRAKKLFSHASGVDKLHSTITAATGLSNASPKTHSLKVEICIVRKPQTWVYVLYWKLLQEFELCFSLGVKPSFTTLKQPKLNTFLERNLSNYIANKVDFRTDNQSHA